MVTGQNARIGSGSTSEQIMAKTPAPQQQGGSNTPAPQQGQSGGSSQQQGGSQPIFRDWAAI